MAASVSNRQPANRATDLETDLRGRIEGIRQVQYFRETVYQRAVKTLDRESRKRGWEFRPPSFQLSVQYGNRVILKDLNGATVAVLRLRHNGKLELLDHTENASSSDV
jgi:hypothetical protein